MLVAWVRITKLQKAFDLALFVQQYHAVPAASRVGAVDRLTAMLAPLQFKRLNF